mmetsp:Transcript_34617/g.80379  ORF Transcript_34617/g.80379 Transcript_34617/m.80379 type:complete len:205 (-) Transcript_34617:101-715(-)|eukprot:CAMPEP_0171148094 /NCGR_PEP_ID=MMETSP0766_2-20121228/148394_1 /TAXON_ID=439317 /ORGANISM="Gambierdiscus australes, Strain CAWD 149" /LENGTH=204 /DNA_ID=CAMNT_0011612003 /DNA_START=59 /DNA_END=673 /DNA_ORIENTATION=+
MAHRLALDAGSENSFVSTLPVVLEEGELSCKSDDIFGRPSPATRWSISGHGERHRMLDAMVHSYKTQMGAWECVQGFLSANGFDGVRARGSRHFGLAYWYPLHCAVKRLHPAKAPAMIWLLLLAGADPSQRDSSKRTPVQCAASLNTRSRSYQDALAVLKFAQNFRNEMVLLPRDSGGVPDQWNSFFQNLSGEARALHEACHCQ